MQTQSILTEQKTTEVEDLSIILHKYHLDCVPVDQYYLQVGKISRTQGWMLHISLVKPELQALLKVLLPRLAKEKVPFKIIHFTDIVAPLLSGLFGYSQLGKTIKVYPENDQQAFYLAKQLIELTLPFRGPAIPTDIHLGGTVYTRYGSFNPVIQHNTAGQPERYIYNTKNILIKDDCPIPFVMPKGIAWPFEGIAKPASPKFSGFLSVLNDTDVVTSVIKGDAKGNVFRSLRMKGWGFQWCIIKEARHDMGVDDAGRDLQDRLRWQYKLQKALHPSIPVPEPYELFEENGNTYFVMEYVKGKSLHSIVNAIHDGRTWLDLESQQKLQLLDYIDTLINYLESLHQKGYVHRDFTSDNFILDKNNRLVMIDMELAYDLNEAPYLPFALGSSGFMSPEQENISPPTIKEDIYALGAIMIAILVNIMPDNLGKGDPEIREENLYFFIGDAPMARIVTQCLQTNPKQRPELEDIKTIVQNYRIKLTDAQKTAIGAYKMTEHNVLKRAIQGSIHALAHSVLTNPEKLWFSNSLESEMLIVNQQNSRNYYAGLYAGIGGVFYMLSCAKDAGIQISDISSVQSRNYEYLQQKFLSNLDTLPKGLYFGTAGLAIALTKILNAGLIPDLSTSDLSLTQSCLTSPTADPSLATGLAGQGLAMLHAIRYLNAKELLQQQLASLLSLQQKDGSWITEGKKRTGFSYGVAGITLFLMSYYKRFNDDAVKAAIEKSLVWLRRQAIKQKNGGITWTISNRHKIVSPWLYDGVTGIALCFTQAYNLFKDPAYQKLAEGALLNHPPRPLYSNLSLILGMAGLGEAYIEAAEVFKDEIWHERADWIAQVIARTSCCDSNDSCYWMTENNTTPTADLMIGNSGITHFLMRYSMPNKLRFPLIP